MNKYTISFGDLGEIKYKEFTIKPYIHNEYDDEYDIIIMYKVSGVVKSKIYGSDKPNEEYFATREESLEGCFSLIDDLTGGEGCLNNG